MKTYKSLLFLCSIIFLFGCKTQKKEVKNAVAQSLNTYAEIAIAQGGQWQDGDKGHQEYVNATSFKNVTQLKVPEQHTDHTWYIRYEGPGWESNKIGYRLYLDWRNAIDIFGKTTDSLVLSKVGQDGFDSYHNPQSWGQDILKVGNSLGIGGIGRLVDTKVLHFKEVDSTFVTVKNTLQSSSISVNYKGWQTGENKINITSIFSIQPNNRITKHTVQTSEAIKGLVTGIVNHNVAYFQKESANKNWAYIATYGKQTVVPDNLGMAIFYQTKTVTEIKQGITDHLIEFKSTKKPIDFYFLGAWEKEINGIKTKATFIKYLNEKLTKLNQNNSLD